MAANDNAPSSGGLIQASYEGGVGGFGGFGNGGRSAGAIGGSDGYRLSRGSDDSGLDHVPPSLHDSVRQLRDAAQRFHDPNAFYDAIISAEGTGKHGNAYDTSLGYTKSPVPLTSMTLGQSLEWGDWIRHHTKIGEETNSSAKGAFQIVNTTQRLAMKALGLHMNELFSEENQRKMASWIAHHQGLGAWASMPTHPREFAQAARALRAGEDREYRRATGLAANSGHVSGKPAAAADGKIEAHVHVHEKVERAHVKSSGRIMAKLTRWPEVHHDYA